MHKILRSFTFNSLVFLAAAGAAACGSANAKADNSMVVPGNQISVVENQNAANTTARKTVQTKTAAPVTSATVAGTYTLNNLKNGLGNDNSLEIEDQGGGKIGVSFLGNYIYKNGAVESAHEAQAEGDARLKGNAATGNLYQYQDDDDSCQMTITFAATQATVKLSSGCQINVALEGVYKKQKQGKKAAVAESSNLREVSYEDLNDFTNDIERHRLGEHYAIINVPPSKINKTSRADESGNSSYKGFYYLQIDDQDNGVPDSFLTSAQMVKSLNANAGEYEPAMLRATAVLIESTGDGDFYRLSFITKIEGLNDDGSVEWTATGGEPSKIKFQH